MEKEKLIISQKPPKGEDGYRTFSIRIREELVQQLAEISAKSGRSRNELIARFVEYGIQNCEISQGK